MKKLIFSIVFMFLTINSYAVYRTASQTLYQQNYGTPPVTAVISATQTFTTAWAAMGTEKAMTGKSAMGLFLKLDVNDSVNMRIRAIAKHTTGSTTLRPPPFRKTLTTSSVRPMRPIT